MAAERLERYREKRDFAATPEPPPGSDPAAPGNRFVVQEHHARRLHWDFRLERDGVLVSWAVPRGLPPDPNENHLAIHTEDHPMSYLEFEGEIPRGNYGAGAVSRWDGGTYECLKFEPAEVMVVLHGERVEGRYVLFQTKDDQWMIHRMDPPQDPEWVPMPADLAPMDPTPGALPADEAGFGFEIDWNGERALVFGSGGRIRARNGDGADVGAVFPELARLGRALGSRQIVLDGEVVALGPDGQPERDRLDRRRSVTGAESQGGARRLAEQAPITYMIYDVLYLDGRLLVERPYAERRRLLEGLELNGFHWQTPRYHRGDGRDLVAVAAERGLAGVVAKRLTSPYRPGEVSPEWIAVRQ